MLKLLNENLDVTLRSNHYNTYNENDENNNIIVSIVPLSFSNFIDNDQAAMDMTYLCKSKSGQIFTIHSLYKLESEDELDFIRNNINFYIDSINGANDDFAKCITDEILLDTIPTYITDLFIKTDEDSIDNSTEKFYIDASYNDDNNEAHPVKFYLSPELMASVIFTESYIHDCIINNHDFNIAIAVGSGKLEKVPIVVLENLDQDNINIAKLDRKNIAILCNNITDSKGINNLLFILCSNSKIDKKTYNTNIDIISNIVKDSDNTYITDFFFTCNINDKPYSIYFTRNKQNEYKMFFLNADIVKRIVDKIILK